ncbi:MAG TPA: rhodanese-like domain-containing protein [Polyangiaceae bacterium]|nr:rhodanese-like domain-containing protein [Polyangiaceae bacterium]
MKKLIPVLFLLAAGASALPSCNEADNDPSQIEGKIEPSCREQPAEKAAPELDAGGNGQFDPKIKPGNPLDIQYGIYQLVAGRGQEFFGGQATGTEREVFASELKQRLDAGLPTTVVDIRPPFEYSAAHLPNAINVPLDQLLTDEGLRALPTDGTPLVVVSADGHGAGLAAGLLGAMGYNAYVLRFGLISWVNSTDVKVQRTDRTQRIQGINGPLAH